MNHLLKLNLILKYKFILKFLYIEWCFNGDLTGDAQNILLAGDLSLGDSLYLICDILANLGRSSYYTIEGFFLIYDVLVDDVKDIG